MKAPIYLSYTAGYGQTFEEFVEFVHNEGFVGLEFIPDLHPNLPEEFNEERITALLTLKQRYDLQYTVHNIYMDINPTSLVPKVRQLAIALTWDVMRFAKAIDAQALVMHTGYRFGPWRTKVEQIELFEKVQRETYTLLANYAAKSGVPLLLENGNYYLSGRNGVRQPLHIGIEAQDLIMIANLPQNNAFGICFDIGKAYLSVNDYSVNEVIKYVKEITPLLREIHLNAFEGYQKVVPDVLAYLKDIDFAGPIVLECARSHVDVLRKLCV
jgi:sugar phosphate isomerase/epimerase